MSYEEGPENSLIRRYFGHEIPLIYGNDKAMLAIVGGLSLRKVKK